VDTLTKDNFLPNFTNFEKHLKTVSFDGEVNPVDGVLYPDISTDIPGRVLDSIREFINKYFDVQEYSIPFMRRMTHGLVAPHQAHSDRVMGTHSVMFYLTNPKGKSGTALLKHRVESSVKDCGDENALKCFEDTNNYEAWEEIEMIAMKKNRLCIFDADRWHRAEPVKGYGSNNEDSRIVLTWFFTAKERAYNDNYETSRY